MNRAVTPLELKAMLHDGAELALFDVREAGEFGESHLLFATPLPYSRLELGVTALAPRRSVRVVLCDDGRADIAGRAAGRLRQAGYTDVTVLAGGTRSWSEAGYALFAGVNVPSKTFGELIEHHCHTPRVTAQELMAMKAAGKAFLLLDGRPLDEHHRMTIPGATCCPNAELPLRAQAMARDERIPIIVNCAGRTRSILGAQTLINFGIPNPVYALENGTQGWLLSGLELEYGSNRRYPESLDEKSLRGAQELAGKLTARFGLRAIGVPELVSWTADETRTTFLCDVRTPEEFRAGTLPGAVHAPGGQLIQATDQWVGVRNARVVVFDGGEMVRAPVVASWLTQLGYEARVLEGGVKAQFLAERRATGIALPELPAVSAAELHSLLATGGGSVLDLGSSMGFRREHVPGSRWTIRPRIAQDARGVRGRIVLIADDAGVARAAARDIEEAGSSGAALLHGGLGAWKAAGYPTESSPRNPPDAQCIDYLFFVHDRHAGNREAMKRYLAWETGLLAQLDEQDKASFRINSPAA
ncbi:MAG: sulfurtransferase [Burkholderiales bacterium]|nr:sulfurtransferase [Burkholderiales bacterium]